MTETTTPASTNNPASKRSRSPQKEQNNNTTAATNQKNTTASSSPQRKRRKINDKNEPVNSQNDSPFASQFKLYSTQYDQFCDTGESIFKISRDVTRDSKKVIYVLQRAFGEQKERKLKDAEKSIQNIVQKHIQKIRKTIASHQDDSPFNYHLFRKKFASGLEEFMEAVSMWYYLQHKTLVSPEELEKMTDFPIDYHDYVMGVADLSGELMRYATASIGRGDKETCYEIATFLQNMLQNYMKLSAKEVIQSGRAKSYYEKKIEVLKANTVKVEKLCYEMILRGAEGVQQQNSTDAGDAMTDE